MYLFFSIYKNQNIILCNLRKINRMSDTMIILKVNQYEFLRFVNLYNGI